VLARMKHLNLVSVSDYFVESGNTYLVMEYVEGESLAERIVRQGALSEPDVLRIADHLLDALSYCHARRVIHRDIKPQNIILRPTGDAVLVDFGLVKLWDTNDPRTRTAVRGAGTAEYAPLEQWGSAGTHTGPYSDIYSLGATLYHALIGEAPPTVTDRMLDPSSLRRPTQVRGDVSARTEAAVLMAMAVQPGERFQAADDMRLALTQGGGPVVPPPTAAALPAHPGVMPGSPGGQRAPASRASRRRVPAWGCVAGAIGALVVVGLLGFAMAQLSGALRRTPSPILTASPTTGASAVSTATVTQSTMPTPELSVDSMRRREADGMVQVRVPGGSFQMGSEDGSSDEAPVHHVTVDGFWLDRTEVTNGQYERCVEARVCRLPTDCARGKPTYGAAGMEEHPVICVDWRGAVAYCQWAGARLPTEAEWEYAARGPEGRVYPWGNTWRKETANCDESSCEDGYDLTAPVGSFPDGASWVGALDMAGNVHEWVADWYRSYPSEAQTHPQGPATGTFRVLRGGSWSNDEWDLRSAKRLLNTPTNTYNTSGFRCASPQSP
jgi:eukaryotic-like serine/threonine-protein kinase